MNSTIKKTSVVEVETAVEVRDITKTYYSINVDVARYAHNINSFRDFKPNSQPSEYRSSVDEAWGIVENAVGKCNSETLERLKYLADRYAKKLASWYNDYNSNEARCPSIMISGSGNFPVRKKEKQNSRRGSLYSEFESIKNILVKMKNIVYQNAIKSNNPSAIELLEQKLQGLQASHEEMKATNAHYRKHKTMQGFRDWSIEKALSVDLKLAYRESWQSSQPFASYSISNNNQNIASVKARIKQLKRDKEIASAGGMKYDSDNICEVIENEEFMRIQLLFVGKPREEVRTILKSNDFKFSPKSLA